ncbi:hypothetical protein FQ186_28350 [Pseudomonas sp. ANT_H14]|uniref:hypothetical protein n=1 Tax=unclassified Pseudomonas TaxID=196821 RepID=UPI0011EEF2A5|nr:MULTISPECIES: hypothetical protein [unclassified Pseudomonas]KAA0945505.1 hypothetical protein FQ186_28350 [Pseudomonas sp. ANT_H14]KAA0946351.1 hypothetical protein FQ182_14450 [Pseudomonas sp. ANT_H4]
MTATTNELKSFSGRILDGFVAITVVFNRLWLALVALPAGVVLTGLLMANDYSPTKVVENFMVISHETIQNLQPGTVAGTYRWTECIDAKTSEKLIAPVPNDQCNHLVSREGTLSEALRGAGIIANVYVILALMFFAAQLYVWPRSRFGLRSKLAKLLRLNRS